MEPEGQPKTQSEAGEVPTSPGPDRGRSVAVALLFVVPLLLLGPLLARGEVFLPQLAQALEPLRTEDPVRAQLSSDGQNYVTSDRLYPALSDQHAMRAALARGELPTWEPLLGLGVPLAAQSIVGAAYPPNWLGFLIPPERAAGPLACLTLLLAGLGAFLFLGRRGLPWQAALLGAGAYQLGGWGVSNLFYYMKVDAALYLPWCLWAVEGLALQRRASGAYLAVAIAGSLLAGFAPIGVFVVTLTGCYACVRLTPIGDLFGERPNSTGYGEYDAAPGDGAKLPPLISALLFGLLGVAGSAAALLPLMESSRESHRQGQTPAAIQAQTLPSSALAGLVLPDLFGSPTEPSQSGQIPAAWWLTPKERASAAENANPLEWNTFVGALVCALALVGIIASPRRAALPLFFLLGAVGFALGLSPMNWLYALPGLSVGSPARALSLAWFLWPWLAALGLAALLARSPRAWGTVAVVGATLAVLGGALFVDADPELWATGLEKLLIQRYDEITSVEDVRARLAYPFSVAAGERLAAGYGRLAVAGLLLLVAAGAARFGRRHGLVWATWILLLAVALEGVLAAQGHVSGRPLAGPVFPASETLDAIRTAADDGRVIRLDRSASGVEEVQVLARPNMLQPYGIRDATPWVVFPPRSFNELFGALDPASRWRQGVSRLSDPALLGHPVLDLLRISAVLSTEPLEHERLQPVLERPGFHVYHRSGALAPARVVPTATLAASSEACLSGLVQGAIDFEKTTLISGVTLGDLRGTDKSAGRLVEFRRPLNSRIEARVEDSNGGWLVIHEQFYPGWRATRNGEPVELLRADHVYSAVALVPGDNAIELVYAPRSVRLGIAISLIALAAAIVLARVFRA